jgi:hypothetical protein
MCGVPALFVFGSGGMVLGVALILVVLGFLKGLR